MTDRQNITAILFDKKGRVLSVGKNNYCKTHPLQAFHSKKVGLQEKIYLHAEIAAIIAAKGKPIKSIIISRFNKEGKPLPAAPCPICRLAIKHFNIKNIYHT